PPQQQRPASCPRDVSFSFQLLSAQYDPHTRKTTAATETCGRCLTPGSAALSSHIDPLHIDPRGSSSGASSACSSQPCLRAAWGRTRVRIPPSPLQRWIRTVLAHFAEIRCCPNPDHARSPSSGEGAVAGGFTSEAERDARSQEQPRLTLIDLGRLVELWIEHSPKLGGRRPHRGLERGILVVEEVA